MVAALTYTAYRNESKVTDESAIGQEDRICGRHTECNREFR